MPSLAALGRARLATRRARVGAVGRGDPGTRLAIELARTSVSTVSINDDTVGGDGPLALDTRNAIKQVPPHMDQPGTLHRAPPQQWQAGASAGHAA
jgi:hypothetical protein